MICLPFGSKNLEFGRVENDVHSKANMGESEGPFCRTGEFDIFSSFLILRLRKLSMYNRLPFSRVDTAETAAGDPIAMVASQGRFANTYRKLSNTKPPKDNGCGNSPVFGLEGG